MNKKEKKCNKREFSYLVVCNECRGLVMVEDSMRGVYHHLNFWEKIKLLLK